MSFFGYIFYEKNTSKKKKCRRMKIENDRKKRTHSHFILIVVFSPGIRIDFDLLFIFCHYKYNFIELFHYLRLFVCTPTPSWAGCLVEIVNNRINDIREI